MKKCFFLVAPWLILMGGGCIIGNSEQVSQNQKSLEVDSSESTSIESIEINETLDTNSEADVQQDTFELQKEENITEENSDQAQGLLLLNSSVMYRGTFGYTDEELSSGKIDKKTEPFGTIEFIYRDGVFRLFGQLNMGSSLQDGKFYNGWLMDSKTGDYVNIGQLTENTSYGELIYVTIFSATNDYTSYNVYIVSEESGKVGNNPSNEKVRVSLTPVVSQ